MIINTVTAIIAITTIRSAYMVHAKGYAMVFELLFAGTSPRGSSDAVYGVTMSPVAKVVKTIVTAPRALDSKGSRSSRGEAQWAPKVGQGGPEEVTSNGSPTAPQRNSTGMRRRAQRELTRAPGNPRGGPSRAQEAFKAGGKGAQGRLRTQRGASGKSTTNQNHWVFKFGKSSWEARGALKVGPAGSRQRGS